MRVLMTAILGAGLLVGGAGTAADADLATGAAAAMAKAVTYLRTRVAVGGGYLGRYKADLSDQWGESHATRDQNWIQPPGTPSVGFAFLHAWEATGEPRYLEAAREVAGALIAGQLECGGWDYIVDHSPKGAEQWFYRRHRDSPDEKLRRGRNQATFDDNTTQHATRLLMAVDQALEQHDPAVHAAALAALEFLLRAQNEPGGWPQRFPLSPQNYSSCSTFNDNTIADCVDAMMTAWRTYADPRYRDAVTRAGTFILRTQQPEPQPVWAQQYDADLKPAWARKFEPPAVTAAESRGVLRTLLRIAVFTGDERYLKPIPPALAWYKRSELPAPDQGKWARFYELGTNRPLYMTRDYKLTFDGSDTPTHYSFKGAFYPTSEERTHNEILATDLTAYAQAQEPKPLSREEKQRRAAGLEAKLRPIVAAQDAEGRWVDQNDLLDMGTFGRNLEALAAYLRLVNDR